MFTASIMQQQYEVTVTVLTKLQHSTLSSAACEISLLLMWFCGIVLARASNRNYAKFAALSTGAPPV
jgi:hypothetical protein